MSVVSLALLAVLAAPAVKPALPVKYPPSTAATAIKTVYRDRQNAEGWLRENSQSYLAAVQRKEFAAKPTLTVGRAPDCDIRIDDGIIRPHHLQVTVVGDSFKVAALDDSALFQVENEFQPRDTILGPSTIGMTKQGALWGRYNLRLSHQRYPALILFDAFSPRFKEFKGIKHYAVDMNYRFVLPMTPNPKHGDTLTIASTKGPGRPAIRLGWFDFMIGNKPYRLTAIHMLEPGMKPTDVAVFFRDATNGKETSGMGRYLSVPRLGGTQNYMLDFNRAENPACVFSDLYNCPLPPKENTLKVPILAGEKDLHYLTATK